MPRVVRKVHRGLCLAKCDGVDLCDCVSRVLPDLGFLDVSLANRQFCVERVALVKGNVALFQSVKERRVLDGGRDLDSVPVELPLALAALEHCLDDGKRNTLRNNASTRNDLRGAN